MIGRMMSRTTADSQTIARPMGVCMLRISAGIAIYDGKQHGSNARAMFPLSGTAWRELLQAVRSDKLDYADLSIFYTTGNLTIIAKTRSGDISWNSKGYGHATLRFSRKEWETFVLDIKRGEYDLHSLPSGVMVMALPDA